MSTDTIIYQQMKLSDRPEVLSFLRRVYSDSPRRSDPEFWNWHYLNHPNYKDAKVPVWLGRNNGDIVGHFAAIPVELNIGQKAVSAAWPVDLYVDERLRRRGIARELLLRIGEQFPFTLATGLTFLARFFSLLMRGLNRPKERSTAATATFGRLPAAAPG